MSDSANTQKQVVTGFFGRVSSTWDRFGPPVFAQFGRQLVELAQVPQGAQVLDVATGTGAVLFPAAEQVGPQGHVIGIDLAEPMVRATATEIRQRGVTNAEVRHMDAEYLEFPDATFDVVLCGFSLQFFPDLQGTLAKFRRVLRSSGCLAVTNWGEQDGPTKRFSELLKAYRCEVRLGFHTLQTSAVLRATFQQAGFDNIEVTPEEVDFVYASEEEWWGRYRSEGPGAALERMEPDTLKRFKADAFTMMQAFKHPNGLHHPRRVLYTIGRK